MHGECIWILKNIGIVTNLSKYDKKEFMRNFEGSCWQNVIYFWCLDLSLILMHGWTDNERGSQEQKIINGQPTDF